MDAYWRADNYRVQNDLDRFHPVQDVANRLPEAGTTGTCLKRLVHEKLIEHERYIDELGQDLPDIRDWMWGAITVGNSA